MDPLRILVERIGDPATYPEHENANNHDGDNFALLDPNRAPVVGPPSPGRRCDDRMPAWPTA